LQKIDPNLGIAVGVGVLISSFTALFVYVKQTQIMKEQPRILLEQTKANSWPHLPIELWRGDNHYGKPIIYKIIVTNKGIGPAILEKTRIPCDGVFAESWNDFYRILKVPDSIQVTHSNGNIHNRVLASNELKELIDWSIRGNRSEGSP